MESRAKKMNRLIFRVLNKTQPPVDDGVQVYTVQRCQEQKIWGWNMATDTIHLEATAKLLKKRVCVDKMIICMYLSWLGIDVRVYM